MMQVDMWSRLNNVLPRLVDVGKISLPHNIFAFQLTLHTTNSKCTMMANGPIPDIELLFESGIPAGFESSDKNPNASSLRIRLSRQHRSLEFAQHVIGDRGPEWTKQLIPCLEVHPFMSESIWVNLEEAKKKAIQQMSHFLRLCETLEAAADDWPARTATVDNLADDGVEKLSDDSKGRDRTRSTSSISSFQILPRPPKLSTGPRRNAWSPQDKVLDEGDGQNLVGTRLSASLDIHRLLDLELTSGGNAASNDLVPQVGKITGPLEARFLSSIGWCTQYGSLGQSPQGEKYKVLFFDGSILDIDLDKGWVELVDGRGKKIR
jgi:polo-like kinase 4